ncbi:MAG: sensor histidine kinase [Deltaproteobacteria bacterium]|nr:MAG: sensor histidine kinase [Deltaproteobacteria bacterium]
MTIRKRIILQVLLLVLLLGGLTCYLLVGTWRINSRLSAFRKSTTVLLGIADIQLGLAHELRSIWTSLAVGLPIEREGLDASGALIDRTLERLSRAAPNLVERGTTKNGDWPQRITRLSQLHRLWRRHLDQVLAARDRDQLNASARLLLEDQIFPALDALLRQGASLARGQQDRLEAALGFFPWLQESARRLARQVEADLDFVVAGNQVYALLNRQFALLQAFRTHRSTADLGRLRLLLELTDESLLDWHRQALQRLGASQDENERQLDLRQVETVKNGYALLGELYQEVLSYGDQASNDVLDSLVEEIETLVQGNLRPGVLSSIRNGIEAIHDQASQSGHFGILALAALLTGIIVQALVSVRSLFRELKVLSFGVAQFRSGNLAHRIVLDGRDELVELAQSLNRMAEELERTRQELEEANSRLEWKVAERTRLLEENNQELLAFNHMVSHDLRNPLSAVLGLSQALYEKAREAGEATEGPLRHIVAGAEKMDRIINALLVLSRVSSQPMHLDAVDLAQCVRRSFADMQERQSIAGAELVAPDSFKVPGSPDLLFLALDHLVRQAWKMAEPGRPLRLELRCETGPEGTRCLLRDNGSGFDPASVGDPFDLRGALGNARSFPGAGLAIAARIFRRHKGDIRVESAPGQGCRYHFTIGVPEELDG